MPVGSVTRRSPLPSKGQDGFEQFEPETKTSCLAHDFTARITSNLFYLIRAIALVLWLGEGEKDGQLPNGPDVRVHVM